MPSAAVHARSWLFAPGDSDRKMAKATASAADIVLLDLEDSVCEDEKPSARTRVLAFLQANPTQSHRLWVRINALHGPHAGADLAVIMAGAPGGIMLPKSRGRADADRLHEVLTTLEAAAGAPHGATKVIVLAAETAQGVITTGSYAGAPRLAALSWGPADLAAELGASHTRDDQGRYSFTFEMARSLSLIGAAIANVPAIETVETDFKNEALLRQRAVEARRDGFRGMLAIHPAQVDVINAAFTPSAEEMEAAQEIVDLFAAQPSVGTIGHKGAMLDRPHLARAQALLAQAQFSQGRR